MTRKKENKEKKIEHTKEKVKEYEKKASNNIYVRGKTNYYK